MRKGKAYYHDGRYLDVNRAATKIMNILRELPTPREAAACIAVVRANLHRQAGGDTEALVRKMIEDDNAAALEIWSTISETALR